MRKVTESEHDWLIQISGTLAVCKVSQKIERKEKGTVMQVFENGTS